MLRLVRLSMGVYLSHACMSCWLLTRSLGAAASFTQHRHAQCLLPPRSDPPPPRGNISCCHTHWQNTSSYIMTLPSPTPLTHSTQLTTTTTTCRGQLSKGMQGSAMAVSRDGQLLAVGCASGHLELLSAQGLAQQHSARNTPHAITKVAVAAAGDMVAVADAGQRVLLYGHLPNKHGHLQWELVGKCKAHHGGCWAGWRGWAWGHGAGRAGLASLALLCISSEQDE